MSPFANILRTVAATAVALLCLDFSLGFAIRTVSGNLQPSGSLQRFFDYGTSPERKLRRSLGANDDEATSLALTGWPGISPYLDGSDRDHGKEVAHFGMSFGNQLMRGMMAERPGVLQVQTFDGPAAPLSHSFGEYLQSRDQLAADVVVIAILSTGLPKLFSTCGATWMTESGPAYHYPRYSIGPSGKLLSVQPPATSLASLRELLATPEGRSRWLAHLGKEDRYYSRFGFDQSPLDCLLTARLLRRAWNSRRLISVEAGIHNSAGFSPESGIPALSEAILRSFVAEVRTDQRTPLVVLIETQGYGGHLEQIFGSCLRELKVPYLATEDVIDTSDGRWFFSDGHLNSEANRLLAQEAWSRFGPWLLPNQSN